MNKMIKKTKLRIKEYISNDSSYAKYKENKNQKFNEYDEYNIQFCKDLESCLKYMEELEEFALFVGRAFSKKNIDN